MIKYSLNSDEKPEDYFLANMYFDVGILDELRLKKSISVTHDGYVFRGSYWETFRRFRKLGLSMIICNLGDFWEGIPPELWTSWKDYNEQPPNLEEKKKLSDLGTFEEKTKQLRDLYNNIQVVSREVLSDVLFSESPDDDNIWSDLLWQIPKDANFNSIKDRICNLWMLFNDRIAKKNLKNYLTKINSDLTFKNKNKDEMGSLFLLTTLVEYFSLYKFQVDEGIENASEETSKIILNSREILSNSTINNELVEQHDSILSQITKDFKFFFDLNDFRHKVCGHKREDTQKVLKEIGLENESPSKTLYLLMDRIEEKYIKVISTLLWVLYHIKNKQNSLTNDNSE